MFNNLKETVILYGIGISHPVDERTGVVGDMLTISYIIQAPKDEKHIGAFEKVAYSNNIKNLEIIEKYLMQTVKVELKPLPTDRGNNYKILSINDVVLK
jgi:hypothetical protein